MTEKSIIGFGRYTDLSVGNLLAMKKTRDLRWIYYNCSMLSFIPDILDKIGITEGYRIEKPGTDKEMGLMVNELARIRISGFMQLKKQLHAKKVLKSKMYDRINKDKIRYSKSAMQARNQGKI